MRLRSYSNLNQLESFRDRFRYLSLGGVVGKATFGFDRWINQMFYQSREWKRVRDVVILRDRGCDLGVSGLEIHGELLVHHMNPITVSDIELGEEWILNPEYLITTTKRTHNAIHYGDETQLARPYVPRTRGDTKLW